MHGTMAFVTIHSDTRLWERAGEKAINLIESNQSLLIPAVRVENIRVLLLRVGELRDVFPDIVV
jgi:hypothetical protein